MPPLVVTELRLVWLTIASSVPLASENTPKQTAAAPFSKLLLAFVTVHCARRLPIRLPELSASGLLMTKRSPGESEGLRLFLARGGLSTNENVEPLSSSLNVRVVSARAAVGAASAAAARTAGMTFVRCVTWTSWIGGE